MAYEAGYVFDLMEQGGPTDVREPYFKNADGLRSLQADDYYLMHMTGARQSREVFIRGLLDGTFKGCEDAGSGTFFITSTSGHDVQKIKRT